MSSSQEFDSSDNILPSKLPANMLFIFLMLNSLISFRPGLTVKLTSPLLKCLVDDLTRVTNKFTGVIPKEIGNLYKLKQLYLDYNKLQGEISEELNNLADLEHLNLRDNMLTGGLPVNMCQNLSVLQVLSVSGNLLNGPIPNNLWQCRELRIVSLFFNNLTGIIPKEIGNITKLKEFYLGYNELQGTIPQELGNLVELEYLHLGNNNLSGVIPPIIGNSIKLKELTLSRINLQDLPVTIHESNFPREFADFGEIAGAKLINDKKTKESKGYAFVQYTSRDDTLLALEQYGSYLFLLFRIYNDKLIYVEIAKSGEDLYAG